MIAEIGSNHNGDMDLAKKLILEAKEMGVDCVKFQSWTKETIFSKRNIRTIILSLMIIEIEKIIRLKK